MKKIGEIYIKSLLLGILSTTAVRLLSDGLSLKVFYLRNAVSWFIASVLIFGYFYYIYQKEQQS